MKQKKRRALRERGACIRNEASGQMAALRETQHTNSTEMVTSDTLQSTDGRLKNKKKTDRRSCRVHLKCRALFVRSFVPPSDTRLNAQHIPVLVIRCLCGSSLFGDVGSHLGAVSPFLFFIFTFFFYSSAPVFFSSFF